jgi:two-component system phosphate regulon sensor histidine kinase PhoR
MREALGAIARGDLGRRLRPRSEDELGEMAAAINDMAEELGLRLEEVTAEKEQLHAVLAGMVEGVLVLDTDGCVTLANPRLRELLSLWGPVEGRKLLEVVRHPGIDDALRAAADSTAPVVSEVEVGDRAPRTLLIHAAAFPQEGPTMGTVAVFHDVTELRHLENVRRDFVANASHELQTPLTAIRGFAETLVGNDLSWEEVRSQLDVILRNSERLENLIRDMRELSRIESRRVPLHPGEVDVVKLAGALLADMEPRLKERSLEVSVADRGAVSAWADRRAVDQVLTNLLDNALKYTDPGGRITVEVESQPEAVRVSVSDTGIGIPAEQQARIFERFYRVDKARSRALGGTGLGLSIVRHLVQAMGGDVYVESEPGQGSTFRFTLPRADRRPA